jgi:hypothetical protein
MSARKRPKTAPLAIGGAAAARPAEDVRPIEPAPDLAVKPARATINLTVDEDLRWAFKEWCTRHRMSQVQAFREAFDLLQERHGR